MKTLLASIVLAATASCLAAQQTLTTTFANNNGGSIGGAIYFDLTSTTGGILTDLDLNFGNAAGTVGSIDIYQIQNGTFAGNETNMASWTMIDSVAVTAAGVGQPTLCPLTIPIILNAQRDAYLHRRQWPFSLLHDGHGSVPAPVHRLWSDDGLRHGLERSVHCDNLQPARRQREHPILRWQLLR